MLLEVAETPKLENLTENTRKLCSETVERATVELIQDRLHLTQRIGELKLELVQAERKRKTARSRTRPCAGC